MRSIIRKAINCGFVLLLFVPLAVYLFTPVKEISQSEKRKLTTFPAISLDRASLQGFRKGFEDYWNDHFGFREQFISLNTRLQTTLLNKSPVLSVISGKEGWLFYNRSTIVSDFLGIQQPSPELLDQWSRNLENRQRFLARHNIHYLLLPVPSKMNIYPEFLPDRYTFFKRQTEQTSLDLLIEHLHRNSSFSSIVELHDLYLADKTEHQVYYKTDTHWNWRGGYLAYREVIAKLQEWYPEMQVLPDSRLRYDYSVIKGDLAIMLGRKNTPIERDKRTWIRKPCSSEMTKLVGHDPASTAYHPIVTRCEDKELTAVVVFDSFGSKLIPFLSEHFRKVTYVNMKDYVWLKDYLLKERPDVFIHEEAARHMDTMLDNRWNLPLQVKTYDAASFSAFSKSFL